MDQFTPQDIADWIGIITVFGALLIVGYHAMVSYCDRQPIYDPLVHGPEDQQEIAAKHVSKRASSQLIGGFLLIEDPALPPNSVRLVYPSNACYVINRADEEAIMQMTADTFEEYKRRCEEYNQRYMGADTIKGKRP